ncbi:hypothetical protein RB192 [Rhodopirellula baltica SH 1]|uniref:Uncharacterized protein n=1 Tax=Rhodopirellula baltica (strain DSM 10527 / NCIMB 13988 / SH1) TaxID=243090 RepID=Q7UZ47_RHOBA|nr:hypothetical protein RB192 [Rhodopirellula baltica SH 1]
MKSSFDRKFSSVTNVRNAYHRHDSVVSVVFCCAVEWRISLQFVVSAITDWKPIPMV